MIVLQHEPIYLTAHSVYESIKNNNHPEGKIITCTKIIFDVETEEGALSNHLNETIVIPVYNYSNINELKDKVDLIFLRKLLETNDDLEQIVNTFKNLNKLKEQELAIKISTPFQNYRKAQNRRIVTFEFGSSLIHIDCYNY